MNPIRSLSTPLWSAAQCSAELALQTDLPSAADAGWLPLRQTWSPVVTEAGFRPGWARIQWNHRSLIYEAFFAGHGLRNSARRLNELTWESGDVCEIFVQHEASSHYIELHVTPENQRLQLRFPLDGIASVRAGQVRLESFMIDDPDWVQTSTVLTPEHLVVRAVIPVEILGGDQATLGPSSVLRTAVCRYDHPASARAPLLSSTAFLSAPAFHHRAEWHTLRLSSADAPSP